MHVKICGLTHLEDALYAAEQGADALGFILAPESPRYIAPEALAQIVSKLPAFVTTVGIFTKGDVETLREVVERCHLDRIQFHGNFPPGTIEAFSSRAIQVIRVKDMDSLDRFKILPARAYLLDTDDEKTAGGSGKTFNWEIALAAKRWGQIILAGGLTPDNVQDAIRQVRPYGVDVSSGVESTRGKKDPQKVRAFIRAAKERI